MFHHNIKSLGDSLLIFSVHIHLGSSSASIQFNWDLNSNRPVPNIDTTAGSVQLDKANNSLTILKFNPLFEGRYECTLETNEDNKKMSNITVSLEGELEV